MGRKSLLQDGTAKRVPLSVISIQGPKPCCSCREAEMLRVDFCVLEALTPHVGEN